LIAVLIVGIVFGSVAAIVIAPMYFRSLERQRMQETLRAAIERGEPIPTDLAEALSRTAATRLAAPPSPSRDLRTGLIWLGVAVGLACMGWALSFDDPDALYPLLGFSAFPAFIGVAFIVMWAVARDKK
jgi:hypothetical protein